MNAPDEPASTDAWEEAIAFGVDVSLLEANLARTPAERLRELVRMQELDDLMRRARAEAAPRPPERA